MNLMHLLSHIYSPTLYLIASGSHQILNLDQHLTSYQQKLGVALTFHQAAPIIAPLSPQRSKVP